MNSKAKKLGSLADIYKSENLDGIISKLKTNQILPSKIQPRSNRTDNIQELAQSIAQDGLLSPIVVCKEGNVFRIIAGERRYHAIQKLNYSEVECRIISREQQDYWRIAIIENLQRQNLHPWEEAKALSQLKKSDNLNDEEVGKLIGKSRNYVAEILSLSSLPENIINLCQKAGIRQLNMMIQVAQAYKAGHHKEFISAYQSGIIDTVKKAKSFRKNKTQSRKKNNPESIQNFSTNDNYKIQVIGNQVQIFCNNTAWKHQFLAKLDKFLASIQ